MNREIGGLFAVFVGVVLVVAAVKGSLKNVWAAVLTPDSGSSSRPGSGAGSVPAVANNPALQASSGVGFAAPVGAATGQAQFQRPGNILVPPPFPPVPGQPGSGVLTGA